MVSFARGKLDHTGGKQERDLNNKTFDRNLVFLFKTNDYSGKLMDECNEGQNFWVSVEEFRNTPSENQAKEYLPMFLEDKYSEAFCSWNDDEPWELVYK